MAHLHGLLPWAFTPNRRNGRLKRNFWRWFKFKFFSSKQQHSLKLRRAPFPRAKVHGRTICLSIHNQLVSLFHENFSLRASDADSEPFLSGENVIEFNFDRANGAFIGRAQSFSCVAKQNAIRKFLLVCFFYLFYRKWSPVLDKKNSLFQLKLKLVMEDWRCSKQYFFANKVKFTILFWRVIGWWLTCSNKLVRFAN